MERNLQAETLLKNMVGESSLFTAAEVWDVLASTNDRAHALAQQGTPEGMVVLADRQTNGRGRMGRSFISPKDDGLYMSLILRPDINTAQPGLITAAAAVAVRRAILHLTGVAVDIKWVNDLWHHGKKLCGILAEGQFNGRGQLSFVVLGIGVNLRRPTEGYEASIAQLVTSLAEMAQGVTVSALALAAEVVRQFSSIYGALPNVDFLTEYRAASCVLGKSVRYRHGEKEEQGQAVAIDEQARLVIKHENGMLTALESGEISLLRPLYA